MSLNEDMRDTFVVRRYKPTIEEIMVKAACEREAIDAAKRHWNMADKPNSEFDCKQMMDSEYVDKRKRLVEAVSRCKQKYSSFVGSLQALEKLIPNLIGEEYNVTFSGWGVVFRKDGREYTTDDMLAKMPLNYIEVGEAPRDNIRDNY